MSNQSLLIDNIAFAKRKDHLTGSLSAADCHRLSELLASQAPDLNSASKLREASNADVISFILDGESNAMGQHFLNLTIKSKLTACCQRCLELMPLNLNLSFDYMIGDLNAEDSEAGEIEDVDDYDFQEASQAMNLLELIEDEIIMALPIAPVHDSDCAKASMQSGEKPNPFAALKGLIKS
jgi:uncharacterized protein